MRTHTFIQWVPVIKKSEILGEDSVSCRVSYHFEKKDFCVGTSTSTTEPPDCCPTVLENGQVCKIDMFWILFCMSSVTVLNCDTLTHFLSHQRLNWIRIGVAQTLIPVLEVLHVHSQRNYLWTGFFFSGLTGENPDLSFLSSFLTWAWERLRTISYHLYFSQSLFSVSLKWL